MSDVFYGFGECIRQLLEMLLGARMAKYEVVGGNIGVARGDQKFKVRFFYFFSTRHTLLKIVNDAFYLSIIYWFILPP